MKLIIAEKPSVAMTIAKVVGATEKKDGYMEGNGYMVSWCYGHLLTNAQPDAYDPAFKKWSFETLPIVPEEWIDVPIDSAISRKQLKILKNLIDSKEVTSLVEATDAGREGELIFRRVYEYTKTKKPFERLWISSLEAASIREGMAHLKPSEEYDNLYQAALARSRADWLFGINGTRFYTLSKCMGDAKATVGRVQTPTLAMIVQRDKEIQDFVVTKRYAVQADFGSWKAETDKFDDEQKAKLCLDGVKGKPFKVESVETTKKSTGAPRLFSLTALQREMNAKAGFSAQKTLDTIQGLYEKKILSYPRTDAEYITSDMEESFTWIVRTLIQKNNLPDDKPLNFKKVINNAKVSDHYAIILTQAYARQCENVQLSHDEEVVVNTVKRRMIEAVNPPYIYNETKVGLDCNGYKFSATGNEVLDPGWKDVAKKLGGQSTNYSKKKDDDESKTNTLPTGIAEGKQYDAEEVSIVNRDTKPPVPYTEATLLAAMEKAGAKEMDDDVERKGLGTSATRAETIEKLLSRNYIVRDKKSLIPTDEGKHLIASVSEGFKSVDTTVEWENRLLGIEKGKGDEDCEGFCASIEKNVRDIIKDSSKDIALKATPVGACPWCTSSMEMLGNAATCTNPECKKKIWARPFWMSKSESFSVDDMKKILADGKVKATMVSKKGDSYKVMASLDREKTENSQYAEWHFDWLNSSKGKGSGNYKKGGYKKGVYKKGYSKGSGQKDEAEDAVDDE